MSFENEYIQQQLPFSSKEKRAIQKAPLRSPLETISEAIIFSTKQGAIYTHEGSSIGGNLIRRGLIKNDKGMSPDLKAFERKEFTKRSKELGFSPKADVWDEINFVFRQVTKQRNDKDNRAFSQDSVPLETMIQLPLRSNEIISLPRNDQLLVADK